VCQLGVAKILLAALVLILVSKVEVYSCTNLLVEVVCFHFQFCNLVFHSFELLDKALLMQIGFVELHFGTQLFKSHSFKIDETVCVLARIYNHVPLKSTKPLSVVVIQFLEELLLRGIQ
jgi:hypothetical protein